MAERILGIDLGIASCGWGVIELGAGDGAIVAAGTWMFNAPEEKSPTGTKLKSAARRTFRGQRRVIRRRRQRMNEVRRILAQYGLLPSADRDVLKQPGLDPWKLRAEGLGRVLTPVELAVALSHIAKHRGFKSNAKGGAKLTDAPDETSKMKKAFAGTEEKLARYETPALMLTEDESFIVTGTGVRRFRNRDGDYSRSLLRSDLAREVRTLFRAQRRLHSGCATEELENEFMDETRENAAFFQRPLKDSEIMVGLCPFEQDQKRSPKHGYSFELFRFLSRLNNLRLGREERRLSVDEIRRAAAHFGLAATFSFGTLRKKLKLPDVTNFVGVKAEEEKKDVVGRTDKGKTAAGTYKLRHAIVEGLGELAWGALVCSPERLDKIAEIISFRDDLGSIRKGLTEAGFDAPLIDVLTGAASDGSLDIFTGAGHISAKAARNIVPGLLQGLTYDKACAQAGYDHTASSERHAFDVGITGKHALARILSQKRISRELVGSPTARKALIEAVKQVKAIVENHGVPDFIHVELARDVGKSIEERGEIERGIEKRNKEKDRLRGLFAEDVGRAPQAGDRGKEELLRYELWREQQGRCLYSGAAINPTQLVSGDNSVQVDHILPWSRFGDDSFYNKTLCTAKANQDKRGRTPFEWFDEDKTSTEWDAFVARVEVIPSIKGFKKRNYKLEDAKEAAEKFRSRNLNDTRWTCRLLAEALKQLYPANETNAKGEGVRRIFTRPGALTDRLRRAWGLQWIKKDENGKRVPDDRHHALDAIVVAATSESLLQRATREVQAIENKGLHYGLTKNITPPWPHFREQAIEAVGKIFVSRAEKRRARGKAHDATIKQIREIDGESVVYIRKAIENLTEKDLDLIPVPAPYGSIADPRKLRDEMVESLRLWLALPAAERKKNPPRSPKGDIIRKVRIATKDKVAVPINGGTVDRGDMARVDVFRKQNKKGKWEFYVVPIYPHQIATMDAPPNRAVIAYKPDEEWTLVDAGFEFLWSLNAMAYVEIVKSNGEFFEGYFRGLHRGTGAMSISSNLTLEKAGSIEGIGVKTLSSFNKFIIDRLGRKSEVLREVRTWRGKACT